MNAAQDLDPQNCISVLPSSSEESGTSERRPRRRQARPMPKQRTWGKFLIRKLQIIKEIEHPRQ
jgi:hypothetical protein